ncbi:MAG TPA: hypothetical protein VFZ36_06815 [Vicinamibacterales bacterium]
MRAGLVAFLVATAMLAGTGSADAQVLGYAIAGPAGVHGFFGSRADAGQAAGGAELLAGGRAGIAGEFGIIASGSGGLLVYSLNGVLHILSSRTPRGASPFVTGGYTRIWNGDGAFNAWNAGAGVDAWFSDHVGARAEFRDQVRPDGRGTVHYWTIRGGLVFR